MLLATVLEHGITHFDTSPYYGFGLAEQDLGRFLKRHRSEITIATKVGLYPPGNSSPGMVTVLARKALGKLVPGFSRPVTNWSVSRAARSLDSSLRRLGSEWIDIVFLHEPDPTLINSDEFLSWLQQEKRKGKIRYWGLAGPPNPMENWLRLNHPLGMVLQVKDSLDTCEADVVVRNGRELQTTYGYLASSIRQSVTRAPGEVLAMALKRNKTGSVLFSTRRAERIAGLTRPLAG